MTDKTRREAIGTLVAGAATAIYAAPAIEQVMTAKDLEQEIVYAGATGSCPPEDLHAAGQQGYPAPCPPKKSGWLGLLIFGTLIGGSSACVAYESGRIDLSPSTAIKCQSGYRPVVEDGEEWCVRIANGRIVRRRPNPVDDPIAQ